MRQFNPLKTDHVQKPVRKKKILRYQSDESDVKETGIILTRSGVRHFDACFAQVMAIKKPDFLAAVEKNLELPSVV